MSELYTKEELVKAYEEVLDATCDGSFGIIVVKRQGDKFENLLPFIRQEKVFTVLNADSSEVLFKSDSIDVRGFRCNSPEQCLDIYKALYPEDYKQHRILKVRTKHTCMFVTEKEFTVEEN